MRYRLTIWILGLTSCAWVGGWLAFAVERPLAWVSGAVLGIGIGALLIAGFLRIMESAAEDHPSVRRFP